MKTLFTRMLTFALLLSWLPTSASSGLPSRNLEAVLADLQPGKTLRIDSRGQGRIEGQYQGKSPDHLLLQSREGLREVHLEGIERIWLRGRKTRTGALVGGALGALGLGLLGVAASGLCEQDCADEASRLGATGALIGAVAGGALGGLVGAAVPDWQLLYQRQD